MVVVKDVDWNMLFLDDKLFLLNVYWIIILGIDFVGGYIIIFVGFYIVWNIDFMVFIGGFLYGYVFYEFYGFLIGM